jgi:hypothetical protein
MATHMAVAAHRSSVEYSPDDHVVTVRHVDGCYVHIPLESHRDRTGLGHAGYVFVAVDEEAPSADLIVRRVRTVRYSPGGHIVFLIYPDYTLHVVLGRSRSQRTLERESYLFLPFEEGLPAGGWTTSAPMSGALNGHQLGSLDDATSGAAGSACCVHG